MKIQLFIAGLAVASGVVTGLLLPDRSEQTFAKPETAPAAVSVPFPETVQQVKQFCNVSFPLLLKRDCPLIWYPKVQDKRNFTALSFYPGRCVYTNVKAGITVEQREIRMQATGPSVSAEFEMRGSSAAVYIDNAYVTELHIDQRGEARIGVGKGIDPDSISYSPVPHPFLKDDFMRVEGEMGEWDIVSGTWSIESLQNPSMSANAFSFAGKGHRATALAGNAMWHNYYFEVSLNFEEGTEAGIITSYTDDDHYTLCSWGGDHITVTRVRGAERKELWRRDKGLTPGQWYRVRGEVSRHGYVFLIDNRRIFSRREPILRRGRFGLYVNGEKGAHFDDAEVGKIQSAPLHCNGDGMLPFSRIGGKWEEKEDAVTCTATDPAKGIWGTEAWSNYEIAARVTPSRSGQAGIGCYYTGEDSYYCAVADAEKKEIRLITRTKGVDTVLGRKPLINGAASVDMSLAVYNSILILKAGDKDFITVLNRDHLSGKPFLFGKDCYNASFDNIRIVFKPYIEPVQSENEIFSAEMTMAEWAGSKSDWLAEKEIFKGNTIVTLWNKASFPGDMLLEANIEKLTSDSKVRLMAGATERKLSSGYSFGITSNRGLEALLLKQDRIVGRKELDPEKKLYRIGFQKISGTVLGLLNGEVFLSFRDPEPLTGTNAGWTVAGTGLSREDVWTYSSSVYNYKFTRSPDEWRVASGIWKVTNRWQCDPRWTFFSGYTDRGSAVLWNKRIFRGDITVEYYAAIKMDRSRGRKYSYASDINCVICSNGRDASDGYNFMFGGFNNQKTCITRNKKTVASTATHVIPVSSNIHRRWFYLRIEKRGNRLRYFLDGRMILEFTDSELLEGSRVGFWTYNNGIMIARVRISSESGHEFEDPFYGYPVTCGTVYD